MTLVILSFLSVFAFCQDDIQVKRVEKREIRAKVRVPEQSNDVERSTCFKIDLMTDMMLTMYLCSLYMGLRIKLE